MKSFEAILRGKIEEKRAHSFDQQPSQSSKNSSPRLPSLSPWVDFSLNIESKGHFYGDVRKIFLKQSHWNPSQPDPNIKKVSSKNTQTQLSQTKSISKENLIFLNFREMNLETQASYKILSELGANLSKEGAHWHTIKGQYRRLAKRFHPDIKSEYSNAVEFMKLRRAYQKLNDYFLTNK